MTEYKIGDRVVRRDDPLGLRGEGEIVHVGRPQYGIAAALHRVHWGGDALPSQVWSTDVLPPMPPRERALALLKHAADAIEAMPECAFADQASDLVDRAIGFVSNS